uniref:Uncharacterized protein n=1 Tax=Romanomermis culicivorax TaxID=13658 RepID=A0A915JF49_ROMCU
MIESMLLETAKNGSSKLSMEDIQNPGYPNIRRTSLISTQIASLTRFPIRIIVWSEGLKAQAHRLLTASSRRPFKGSCSSLPYN